jgi:hypothetical protein
MEMSATDPESSSKKIRVTIDLASQFHKRLTELERRVGAESKAGVIRQALQLYEYMVDQALSGATFYVENGAGTAERIVFFGGSLPRNQR